MIGQNRMTLNQETLARMVQEYLNAHTFQKSVRVVSVFEESIGNGSYSSKQWVATIEPTPEPVAEVPAPPEAK